MKVGRVEIENMMMIMRSIIDARTWEDDVIDLIVWYNYD